MVYLAHNSVAFVIGKSRLEDLEAASHAHNLEQRKNKCARVLSSLSPLLHSPGSKPGEWCLPQWALSPPYQ